MAKPFPCYLLDFKSIDGLEGTFATFRLGKAWQKRLQKGDTVVLSLDKMLAYGKAKVARIESGKILDMLAKHAHNSHMEKDRDDIENAPRRRFEGLRKIYGPQKVTDNASVTVIYLRMMK